MSHLRLVPNDPGDLRPDLVMSTAAAMARLTAALLRRRAGVVPARNHDGAYEYRCPTSATQPICVPCALAAVVAVARMRYTDLGYPGLTDRAAGIVYGAIHMARLVQTPSADAAAVVDAIADGLYEPPPLKAVG